MDEETRRAFDDLRSLIAAQYNSLNDKVEHLNNSIEGNGKPGIKEDLNQLRRNFEIHTATELNCPLISNLRGEFKDIVVKVNNLEEDFNKKELNNKELTKTQSEHNFVMGIESKRFWLGAKITIGIFIISQILQYAYYVHSLAK